MRRSNKKANELKEQLCIQLEEQEEEERYAFVSKCLC